MSGTTPFDHYEIYVQTPSTAPADTTHQVWQDMGFYHLVDDGFDANGNHLYEGAWSGYQMDAKFAAVDSDDRSYCGLQDGYKVLAAGLTAGAADSTQTGVADGDLDSGDGISYARKWQYGLNPTSNTSSKDSVGNGLPDWFRNYIGTWFGPGNDDPWADPDGDHVPNIVEYELGLDPTIQDYWGYSSPPSGDESLQFVSLQISAPYGDSDGPNDSDGNFPGWGWTAGPLGEGFLMTASTSTNSGPGVANLDFEVWPLDQAYTWWAPFSSDAQPEQGEIQEPDQDWELYRDIMYKSTDLAHHIWGKVNKQVLESLSSKSLEYVYATSVMKVHIQCRQIQYYHALQTAGVNQPGLLLRIQKCESTIHTEITKEVAISLRYVKAYPNLDWVNRILGWGGRAAVCASLLEQAPQIMDAAQGYLLDVHKHQNTAGAALFSSYSQQALIDYLNLFHVPGIEFIQVELSPETPIFDPIPLGMYDGGH